MSLLLLLRASSTAVTATNLTTSGDATDLATYTTASVTPTGNRLLLLWVYSIAATAPNQPTVTGNGLTWVNIGSVTDGSGVRRLTLFRAMGASPTTGSLSIAFGGQTQTGAGWSLVQYANTNTSGTNGSGAIVQAVTNFNAGTVTSLTVTLGAFSNVNNATAGGFGIPLNTAGQPAVGTGFTATGQYNATGPNLSIGSEFLSSNDTTVDMNAGAATIPWTGIAVEIKSSLANPTFTVLHTTDVNKTKATIKTHTTDVGLWKPRKTIHTGSYAQDSTSLLQTDTDAMVNSIVTAIPNVTHIAIATFLDFDSTSVNDQFAKWASSIHGAGKKMYVRSAGFNDWQGSWGATQYTGSDFADHHRSKMVTWLGNNASSLQAGDIFEPVPDEPENNSMWNTTYVSLASTAGKAAFNAFIVGAVADAKAKLALLGKTGIEVGVVNTNPSVAKDIIDDTTAASLDTIGTSNYPDNGAATPAAHGTAMASELATWVTPNKPTLRKDITFGPNIYTQLTEQDQADAMGYELTAIQNALGRKLGGVTIWQAGNQVNGPYARVFEWSGSAWTPRKATQTLNAFFGTQLVTALGYTREHTTSVLKRAATIKIHSTDVNKKSAGILKTHTTDTLKRKQNTKIHTTDTLKLGRLIKTHTTDVYKYIPSVTLDSSTGTNPASGTAITWSHTVASQSNRILVVALIANEASSGAGVTSMTYNGVSMTRLRRVWQAASVINDFWYLINPPVGTFTIQANYVTSTIGAFYSRSYYNVDQTTPFFANPFSQGASSGSTTRSLSVVTTVRGIDIFALYDNDGGSITAISPTMTQLGGVGTTSDISVLSAPTTATYTVSYTNNSDANYAFQLVALQPPIVRPTRTHTTDVYTRSFISKTHTTDTLKRKQTTKTHFTDVNKRQTITKIHSTDVNKKKATLLTHTTDTLKRSLNTKTHTTDVLKRGVYTRIHTTDVNKKKAANLRTHTTDVLKRAVVTKTHTTDVNKRRANILLTHTTDLLKRKQNIKTHTTDVLKRSITLKTHTTDVLKRSVATRSHSTDLNKRKITTRLHTTDTNKRLVTTRSHSTDVAMLFVRRLNFVTNPQFDNSMNDWSATGAIDTTYGTVINPKSFKFSTTGYWDQFHLNTVIPVKAGDVLTASVYVTTLAPHTPNAGASNSTNAIIYCYWQTAGGETVWTGSTVDLATVRTNYRMVGTLTAPAGATAATFYIYQYGIGDAYYNAPMLERNATVTPYFDGDSINAGWRGTVDYSTSYSLSNVYPLTHGTDTFVRLGGVRSHTTDTLKRANVVKTHSTDVLKRLRVTKTHTTDVLKRKLTLRIHTTDANKRKANILRTHTTDVLKRAINVRTHTTDVLKRLSVAKTHTTDVFTYRRFAPTHTTDTLKRMATTRSHTTDVNKRQATLRTHSTDVLKRKATSLTHTTDVNKRKSAITRVHNTDTNKRKGTLASHTTDVNKRSVSSRSHTTDVLKRKTVTLTHTTSVNKRKVFTLTYTTDVVKRAANARTHTTDTNKRKLTTASHSTDVSVTYDDYSREDLAALPANDNTLATRYTGSERGDVSADDSTYTGVTGLTYLTHEFKHKHTTSNSTITPICNLKTTLAPSISPVYLQIYNQFTGLWETLDSDNTTAANTDFTLTGSITTSFANYYNTDKWVTCRIYQEMV